MYNIPKRIDMKIVTTREMVRKTKEIFKLAENERVIIKRPKEKYVNLIITDEPSVNIVTEDWIKEFMDIPNDYRQNPFDYSASGDLFFADKRNTDKIKSSIQETDVPRTKILAKDDQRKFLNLD